MEWTDLKISAPRIYADTVEAIATGISGGGIYIEDYGRFRTTGTRNCPCGFN